MELLKNPTTAIQPITLHFNDTEITCPLESGHRMIPVKTVCEIIGVRYTNQDSWLKQHPFYGQLYQLTGTVGADGKARKMNCLSILDIDGWLNSITQQNREKESIDRQYAFLAWLREKKLELYKSVELFIEENRYELDLLNQKSEVLDQLELAQESVKDFKKKLSAINKSVEEVRAKRFTGQTAIPFPSDN